MRAKAFRRRSSNTTPPPSSTRVRGHVDTWRNLAPPNQWQVTPETARLLQHWRHHKFSGVRPFFCQVEAVETAIWLTEVAPTLSKPAKRMLGPSRIAQQRRQSRTDAPGAEAGHRRRQDHRHGHAHRVADDQCGAPLQRARHFTRGFLVVRAGPDDQGPAARPPAERPRQLLRQPRTGPAATCWTT